MTTESKVIELFCMADVFCKFFDVMMTKYMLKPATKRKYPMIPPCLKRKSSAQASASLTALPYGYARVRESISIRRSRE